jgi:hypothetical protein
MARGVITQVRLKGKHAERDVISRCKQPLGKIRIETVSFRFLQRTRNRFLSRVCRVSKLASTGIAIMSSPSVSCRTLSQVPRSSWKTSRTFETILRWDEARRTKLLTPNGGCIVGRLPNSTICSPTKPRNKGSVWSRLIHVIPRKPVVDVAISIVPIVALKVSSCVANASTA